MNKVQTFIRETIEKNLTVNAKIKRLTEKIATKTRFFWSKISENIITFNMENYESDIEGILIKIKDTHHNPETGKVIVDTITISYGGIVYDIDSKGIIIIEKGNPKPEDYQELYDIIVILTQSYRALD